MRETLRVAALLGSIVMLALTTLCQWRPDALIPIMTSDPEVTAVGGQYLAIISWNFVASGLILTCSGLLQALGNTLSSLASSASRVVTFTMPALVLASRHDFTLEQL